MSIRDPVGKRRFCELGFGASLPAKYLQRMHHSPSPQWSTAVSTPFCAFAALLLAQWFSASLCFAEARPKKEYEKWVAALASPNKAPPISDAFPEAKFPPNYDFGAQKTILDTWERLNNEIDHAFPVLVEHANDRGYSCTLRDGYGYDENYTVGWVCTHMIERHTTIWRNWVQSREKIRTDNDRARGGYLEWYFDWSKAAQNAPNGKQPSLFDVQVKMFDWANARQEQEKLPAARQGVLVECLRRRRAELIRSGRPIRCATWWIEEFDFLIPGRFYADRQAAWRKSEKSIQEAVSNLTSPNAPPEIIGGKVMRFPTRYSRAAQERVAHFIRTLNKNVATALPALVNGVNQKSYCMTLQGPDGKARNLAVSEVCCLLLAANVNVYRPYLDDLPGDRGYPMLLRPSPAAVKAWWAKFEYNSLRQIQHEAFRWATAVAASKRNGLRDSHERDVAVEYLQRRTKEYWFCQVPIIVDVLARERVVLPKDGH